MFGFIWSVCWLWPSFALTGVTKDPTNSTEMATSVSRNDVFVPEDLFLPGTLYYLQRDIEDINDVEEESYTLWKGDPGENFQRILLSGNLISDHRCESIYYALREVLKTLPPPRTLDEWSFFSSVLSGALICSGWMPAFRSFLMAVPLVFSPVCVGLWMLYSISCCAKKAMWSCKSDLGVVF